MKINDIIIEVLKEFLNAEFILKTSDLDGFFC